MIDEIFLKNEVGQYYISNFGIAYDSKNKCYGIPRFSDSLRNIISFSDDGFIETIVYPKFNMRYSVPLDNRTALMFYVRKQIQITIKSKEQDIEKQRELMKKIETWDMLDVPIKEVEVSTLLVFNPRNIQYAAELPTNTYIKVKVPMFIEGDISIDYI